MNYKVLIADLVGLKLTAEGVPDCSEIADFIRQQQAEFHLGSESSWSKKQAKSKQSVTKDIHFFYQPELSTKQSLIDAAANGQYDAVIAAATHIPKKTQFFHGGVRIGSGTGNMASASWGGADGIGGDAPLMNTPSFNARATAHMVFKAILASKPDMPLAEIQQQVIDEAFDTGRDLIRYPTIGLEGQTIAILGYGHIGREVAKIARCFGLKVRVFARARHRQWIESQGYQYASSAEQAAAGADILTPHLGLGEYDEQQGCFANEQMIDKSVLQALNDQAVVINFDRGELVDIKALSKAMKKGQVQHVAIDADIFVNDGEVSGPLKPYLKLQQQFDSRVSLMPHIAADTEHNARVAGAKQAIRQMITSLREKKVINVKGEIPAGYEDGGKALVDGVGAVNEQHFHRLNQEQLNRLAYITADLAEFWREMSEVSASVHTESAECLLRDEILKADAEDVVKHSNELLTLLTNSGLLGPYESSH